jgi:hypothetical protein
MAWLFSCRGRQASSPHHHKSSLLFFLSPSLSLAHTLSCHAHAHGGRKIGGRACSLSQEEKKRAHYKFQKLQMAYDLWRDPEKRQSFDRGQLIH